MKKSLSNSNDIILYRRIFGTKVYLAGAEGRESRKRNRDNNIEKIIEHLILVRYSLFTS